MRSYDFIAPIGKNLLASFILPSMFIIAVPSSGSTCQNPSADPDQSLTDITSLHPFCPSSSLFHISAVAQDGFGAQGQTQHDQENKKWGESFLRHTRDNLYKKRDRPKVASKEKIAKCSTRTCKHVPSPRIDSTD